MYSITNVFVNNKKTNSKVRCYCHLVVKVRNSPKSARDLTTLKNKQKKTGLGQKERRKGRVFVPKIQIVKQMGCVDAA